MRLPARLDVLRLRDFRLVFGASVASLLGDGVVPVALAFAVLDATGSATDLGLVLAARTVALAWSLLIGGVVADRIGRRTVMVLADVSRLVIQAAIALLLIKGRASVAELVVSQAVLGAASGFFNPASSGLMPAVAGERLQEANALRGLASSAGSIVGPAIAGVLVVAADPGWALLVDAASYAISAALLVQVPRDRVLARPKSTFVGDLRDGFGEVRSRTWMWATLIAFAVINAVATAFPVLGALVAKQRLGGAAAWSAILVARAIGSLIGGTALLGVRPRRPLLIAILFGLLSAFPTILLAIPAPLAVIVVAALVSGLGPMVFDTLWETTWQAHIPAAARSRVSAYDWIGSFALAPLGFALVGPLAGAIGLPAALYMCGALDFAVLGSLLTVREIRTLPPRPATPSAATGRGSGG